MQLVFVKYKEFIIDNDEVIETGVGLFDLENEEFINRVCDEEFEKEYLSLMPNVINTFIIKNWSSYEQENEDGDYVDMDVAIEIQIYTQNKLKSVFSSIPNSKLAGYFTKYAITLPSNLRKVITFNLNVLGISPKIEPPYIIDDSHLREINNVLLEFGFSKLTNDGARESSQF